MTEIFTLWIGNTNPICRMCMKSWQKLGYHIVVYTDMNHYDPFLDQFDKREYRTILDGNPEDILPFSDLFRYKRLYQQGGIWVDADMYLLKKIPHNEYIISSERTAQTGAFKRKIEQIPNIGIMKFPAKCSLLEYVIKKIEKSRSKSKKVQKNMFVYQDAILKAFPTWLEEVAPAFDYCPVNWSNVKELYLGDKFTSKYGQKVNQIDEILENAIGVHMWENLTIKKYKINFDKIHKDSLFRKLSDLV